ncbi:MAG: NusG domain II-containing protein, partial [Desulfobacterales bacterium]|nr:NusG domain II-containing protein [Desulfobacterales bacterium]
IIETKQGGIRIKKSDCPRQICVNTGWIKTPGRIIVCVPNKILIEIKSEKPLFLDAVVH